MTTSNKVLIGAFGVVALGGIITTIVVFRKKPASKQQVSTTTTTTDVTQHGGIGSALTEAAKIFSLSTGEESNNFLGYNLQTV